MRYSEIRQTCWHETDAQRHVRPSQLLVYMQETSNQPVSSFGTSLDELRDQKHLGFILSKLRLAILHLRVRHINRCCSETIGKGDAYEGL